MDHPRKLEHEDSHYQSLGVGAYLEEAKEAKSPEINVGARGDGSDEIWPKPDLEVATGEGSALGFVDVGAEAPGTKTDEENKGCGVQDQDQRALKAAARIQQLQDDTNLHMICGAFSRLQLNELERIFQRTQYPNVFLRKELGIPVNVEAEAEPCEPEDEVSK